jgi:hypothetical protein
MASHEVDSRGGAERRTWRFKAANTLAATALLAAAASCGNDSAPCEATFKRASEHVITMPDDRQAKAGVFGDEAFYMVFDESNRPKFADFLNHNNDIKRQDLARDGAYDAAVFPYDDEYELVIRADADGQKVETFCQPAEN